MYWCITYILITYYLDYCNMLYMCLPLKTTQKLQLSQNAMAHIVFHKLKFVHLLPLLWDSIGCWFAFSAIQGADYVFSTLLGLGQVIWRITSPQLQLSGLLEWEGRACCGTHLLRKLIWWLCSGSFPVEHHSLRVKIDPHLVTFLKGPEDLVLSAGLVTSGWYRVACVIMSIAAAGWREGVGFFKNCDCLLIYAAQSLHELGIIKYV